MAHTRGQSFGILEQRELKRLCEYGATPGHIALFIVMRVRADPSGEVRDGFKSLGRWSRMGEKSVKRSMRWFVERHVVAEPPAAERVRGGEPGAVWVWPRRIKPFEFWVAPPSVDRADAADAVPLWRLEGRKPDVEELLRYKAAGGQL